jgi:hypothetical protein
MSITFGDLKRKILLILADEVVQDGSGEGLVSGNTYSSDLLKDSVHAALDAITSRCWKNSVSTIAGGVLESDLPSDLIDIEAVYEKTIGSFIPKLSMLVGDLLGDASGNGWIPYPTGKISFMNSIGVSGCTVYYSSTWTHPEDDVDVIESPGNADTCLILYAASYCLINTSVDAANLGNFKTKVDSGQPTDNPAKDMSTYILKRFDIELQRLPMMEKGRQR